MPLQSSAVPGPISRTLVSQRLKLHYLDWGKPSAPPIVLVHGGRDNCHTWDWLAPHLAQRFRVI
ncbi:MAG TPA: alpha/beta hydrolase, partial [Hyphomicrobiaceae bacterium]|nr:alpha/beta hydrolase [Hyphomicrobiaceae bacterium]